MEQHCRDMLDAALLNFHSELGRYDWVPSTAMAGDPTDCCIRKQLVMVQWESIVVAESIRQSYFLSADVFDFMKFFFFCYSLLHHLLNEWFEYIFYLATVVFVGVSLVCERWLSIAAIARIYSV